MKYSLRNILLTIQDNLLFFDYYGSLMIKKKSMSQLIFEDLILFKVPQITINVIIYGNLLTFVP